MCTEIWVAFLLNEKYFENKVLIDWLIYTVQYEWVAIY